MSRALEYLLAARGEALTAYFAFFKHAGKHLDPKTRAIISVITKVDAQTASGFHQYLKRALTVGVSANEILDALLTAMPTLGFTKIVWAVEQLQEMQLPEFAPAALAADAGAADIAVAPPQWHKVGAVGDFTQTITACTVAGHALLVVSSAGDFIIYDAHCPHQQTRIEASALEDGSLQCSKHGWRFDLHSGACIERGNRPLARYPHRVTEQMLWVQC